MNYILRLIVSAALVLLATRFVPGIHVTDFWSSVWAAFLIGLVDLVIGTLITLGLAVMTFGLSLLLGFLVRVLISGLMVLVVSGWLQNFEVDGYLQALFVAVLMALGSRLVRKAG